MIKSLKIQNFQSHEHTTLNFSPGVNVIVGSSDSGKTAIIRALRWAVWNRPSGDSLRSHWGGDTICLVETEEGAVLRFKGKEDRYEIKRGEQRSVVFKAFGTNVPEEVATLFNINEINLQGQLDAPFLLSESPGAVAAHFNKIARLDQIDRGVQNVNSWIRELTSTKRYKEGEKEQLESRLSEFDNLEQFEQEVEVVEQLEERKKNLMQRLSKLQGLLNDLDGLNSRIDKITPLLALEKDVDTALTLFGELREHEKKFIDLNKLVLNIEKLQTLENAEGSILLYEKDVDNILRLFDEFHANERNTNTLSSLVNTITATDAKVNREQINVEKRQKEFDREMPDVCPLCDQPIKK